MFPKSLDLFKMTFYLFTMVNHHFPTTIWEYFYKYMFKTSRPANPRILLHRILLGLLDFFVFLSLNKSTNPRTKKDDDMCVFFGVPCFFCGGAMLSQKNLGFLWFKILGVFFDGFQPGVPASWSSNLVVCHGGLGFFGPEGWIAVQIYPRLPG